MKNYLLLLFLYIVWGTTYTAIPFALKGFTPFLMASARYLLVGLVFLPFTTRADWEWKRAWPQVLGGVSMVIANSLVMWSQKTMPSGLASLFIATVPLWFMMVNWLFFEKKVPEKIAVAGLLLGISGVGYLSYATGTDVSLRASAAALMFASFVWVVGSLFIRRSMVNYKTFPAISVQMISGGLFLTIVSIAFSGESISANFSHGIPEAWAAFFYLTIVGSVLALTVYNILLKTISPPVVGTYALVNPLVAMVLGQVVLGEALTADMLWSMVLILGGVSLLLYSSARQGTRPKKD